MCFAILLRIIKHPFICFKKRRFFEGFKECGKNNYFGTDDCGKSCKVIGKENIVLGEGNSFGEDCEIIAMNSHMGRNLLSILRIGNHVRVTARCRITCAKSITIDNDVLIAPEVFITDHNHGMNPDLSGGYSSQALIMKKVHICEGVWLGQRVCVLPGVTIGAHSIIGANSVVTHDIPAYAIAVGSPARVVKRWNIQEGSWMPVLKMKDNE